MIILVTLAVVFAVLISFRILASPFDKTDNTFSNVVIEKGDDMDAVAAKLKDEGIIADASRFKLISKMMMVKNFKSGTYYLSPSMSSVEIAKLIENGFTTSNGFTIPAGYTIDQIASSLARDGFIDKDDFLDEAGDKFFTEIDFIGKEIQGKDQIEGFLLPDSYVINSDADEAMIIFTMLDNFNNYFNEDYKARAAELGFTTRQVIALASMIEKETNIEGERGTISGIIHNRINLDMDELPEIPLCSPSKESIFSALYPEENDFIYYVQSDKLDGSHSFATGEAEYEILLDEYNKAIEERNQTRDQEEDN